MKQTLGKLCSRLNGVLGKEYKKFRPWHRVELIEAGCEALRERVPVGTQGKVGDTMQSGRVWVAWDNGVTITIDPAKGDKVVIVGDE